jgi:simple sugar transport system permease protein
VGALALLLLVNLGLTRGFFVIELKPGIGLRDWHYFGTLIDILNHGSKVMLLALGMTLVIATGGVDLSVGAVMALCATIAAQAVVSMQWPFWAGALLALGIALLAGAWNGFLVAGLGLQPIVATLILMVSGRGIAQLVSAGQIITFTDPWYTFIGNGHVFRLPFTLTLVLAMLALTSVFTRATALGLFIEAVGDNPTASRYSGVSPRLTKFLVYTFSGFCAGLAGLIAASNVRSADANHCGLFLELDAIVAVVIGGTALTGGRFSLVGSMVGALFIQALTTTLYARDVSSDVAPVPKALAIVAVCLLQSEVLRQRLTRALGRTRR